MVRFRTAARVRATTLALSAMLMALTSCREADAPVVPTVVEVVPDTPPVAAVPGAVECTVDMRTQEVKCPDVELPEGAGMQGGAMVGADRVIGGQGLYVRLSSSGVAYNSGTGLFTFNVTVQNLTSAPMASADGIVGHADGVRAFIVGAPSVTSGSGVITVSGDGTDMFTAADQPYYQYGGGLNDNLGADDILSASEVSAARTWTFNVPTEALTFTFQALVATHMDNATLVTIAPQVTNVPTLVPGTSAVITGTDFHATPASNTVLIGGVAATVTGGTATTLTVTVPCRKDGATTVQVAHSGRAGVPAAATIDQPVTTVAIGEIVLLDTAQEIACTELAAAGGAAEYIVTVFSNSTSPSSNSPFTLSSDNIDAAPGLVADKVMSPVATGLSSEMQEALEAQAVQDDMHGRLLEQNRRMYEVGMARFPGGRRPGEAPGASTAAVEPPLTRKFRISNISPPAGQSICSSFYVVQATRVYYNGKIAIYEDDATPDAFKSALNATMASNYLRMGDQFNADMEPVLATYFGDVLRRDDVTDNNDVLVALFTPRINTSFSGVAGFVVSCDQFPNDDATATADYAVGGPYNLGPGAAFAASNFGEFFYAYQPVTNAAGYSGNTPENWYRTIRSTFIHEAKHVVSQAARVANGSPSYEASWLEEGTARHAEELWMREAVDNVEWKANTGYGSFASPINLYCDVRPGFAECDANTRRPASIMQRHFTSLYTHLFGVNARLLSPFGATASDNAAYWYAISWSLVRHAIDNYATTEAAFLTDLTESTTSGVDNLLARAGVSLDVLLAGWTMALVTDDYPGLAGGDPTSQFATWNFRNIYTGLNTDFPATYTLSYPQVPANVAFGDFTATAITTLRGGGSLWYRLNGTQSATQLLQARTSGGVAGANVRMAVMRVQ